MAPLNLTPEVATRMIRDARMKIIGEGVNDPLDIGIIPTDLDLDKPLPKPVSLAFPVQVPSPVPDVPEVIPISVSNEFLYVQDVSASDVEFKLFDFDIPFVDIATRGRFVFVEVEPQYKEKVKTFLKRHYPDSFVNPPTVEKELSQEFLKGLPPQGEYKTIAQKTLMLMVDQQPQWVTKVLSEHGISPIEAKYTSYYGGAKTRVVFADPETREVAKDMFEKLLGTERVVSEPLVMGQMVTNQAPGKPGQKEGTPAYGTETETEQLEDEDLKRYRRKHRTSRMDSLSEDVNVNQIDHQRDVDREITEPSKGRCPDSNIAYLFHRLSEPLDMVPSEINEGDTTHLLEPRGVLEQVEKMELLKDAQNFAKLITMGSLTWKGLLRDAYNWPQRNEEIIFIVGMVGKFVGEQVPKEWATWLEQRPEPGPEQYTSPFTNTVLGIRKP